MNGLTDHIIQRYGEYSFIITLIATAFVKTIPENFPSSLQEWWAWFRGFTQLAANVQHTPANPIQPEAPAKTK